MAPTYTLASNNNQKGFGSGKSKNGSKHRRSDASNSDPDPTDGQGSLTYSATSSVHSGGSATGESTDSSFADVMRVLDLQDTKELHALIKKEGVSTADELREKRRGYGHSGVSVASSLNYSTDGESHLEGSQLLQTIAGQPSDSYAFDGGGYGKPEEEPIKGDDILFAPAEPANVKKKKRKEKSSPSSTSSSSSRDRSGDSQTSNTTTPKSKNSSRRYEDSSPSGSSVDTPTKAPPDSSSKAGTPPPVPPKSYIEDVDDEDIWYAKWWMSCFPDTFKNLVPKR